MFSFFRRQKTADSDKDGKCERDKKETKVKEKSTAPPPSPGTSKREVTKARVQEVRRSNGLGDAGRGVSVSKEAQNEVVQRVATVVQSATPPPPSRVGVPTSKDPDNNVASVVQRVATVVQSATPPPPPRTGVPTSKEPDNDVASVVQRVATVVQSATPPPPPRVGVPTSKEPDNDAASVVQRVATVVQSATPPPTPRQEAAHPLSPPLALLRITPAVENSEVVKRDSKTAPISQHSTAADNQREGNESEAEEKRNLVNQETRFQEQLAQLTAQLTARDAESNQLTCKMEELQRDIQVKSWGMDRLQAELLAAHKESECVRHKLRKMEEDVTQYRQKNQDLSEELLKKAEEEADTMSGHSERVQKLEDSVKEWEEKVKELEKELEELRVVRDRLEEEKAQMEAEREEEMNIVQEALDEAQEEKEEIQAQYERDFEKLRTVNTDREQQLLDDFEWKLREVEQACKKRLEDKDKKAEEKLATWRTEMADKIKEAEKQLTEVQHLKAFEAEAQQLRGVTHDQQRALRTAQRQTEQLQVTERMLKEEISTLRAAVDEEKSMAATLQKLNEKKVSELEKRFQSRLEQQKNDMNDQWEERMRRECFRLKTELNKLHTEEKQLAVESLKTKSETEMKTAKQNWERRLQDSLKEVSELKASLAEKEAFYYKEIEKAQTNADRDILDLRRKLDKMDMSYQEQIEKLHERYEKEIEQLNWEAGRKIQQVEQGWQLQASSTRTTLELVKEQMERDTQAKLETLEAKHCQQSEEQWDRLTREKEAEIEDLEQTHQKELEKIREEFEKTFKTGGSREEELMQKIASLEAKLREQCALIGDLQGNADLLHGSVLVLNEQIVSQGKEVQRTQAHAVQKIKERETELEAEWGSQLATLKKSHDAEMHQCNVQHADMREQMLQKIDSLSKLVEETRAKDKSPPPPDREKEIADLRKALAERDQELTNLMEEKRFYQLELINRETTYNQIFRSEPTVGLMDPLQHISGSRKKGGGRGTANPHHQPTPPRLVPKSPRKQKKVGNAMTPAQVLRSKSLEFKHPSNSQTKHKTTHPPTNTETKATDDNFTISTL